MLEAAKGKRKKLRKQPKRRTVESTGFLGLPKLVVPKTAKKRHKRNNPRLPISTGTMKKIVTSSRWLSTAILFVCLFALILIGRDSSFILSSIPVEGNLAIPDSEIIAASGLAGKHIFSSDPEYAAVQIGQVPGVISATVVLKWPNSVAIEVKEDTPVAIWEQGGRSYWVTADNRLVPARSQPPNLLHIESEVKSKAEDFIFLPDDVVSGGLQLRQLRSNIHKLSYLPGSGLSFQDGRGWRVHFGSGLDMEQKLAVYETLVDDLLERGVRPTYISVRNQERPYYSVGINWTEQE
jgi:hypothetical protein